MRYRWPRIPFRFSQVRIHLGRRRRYPDLAGLVRLHLPDALRSDGAIVLGVRHRLLALFGNTV